MRNKLQLISAKAMLMAFMLYVQTNYILASDKLQQITETEAFTEVSKLFKDKNVDYYSATLRENNNQTNWIFFVDAKPLTFWQHECYLISVPKYIISSQPTIPILSEQLNEPPAEYKLKPYSVSHYKETTEKFNYLIDKNRPVRTSTTLSEAKGKTYAIILSGNANINMSHFSFWYNCSYMYQALRHSYGIPKSDIYVLFSDGENKGNDIIDLFHNETSSNPDFDGDGDSDVYETGSKANLIKTLNTLIDQIQPQDELFMYISCHGGFGIEYKPCVEVWYDTSSGTRSKDGFLYAEELKSMLHPFTEKGINVNLVVDACKSGAFIKDFATERCVITTSTNNTNDGYTGGINMPYSIFSYYWISALNHYFINNGRPVPADSNGDGHITMAEAYKFASKATDDYILLNIENYLEPQFPQYRSTPTSLGEQLAINYSPFIDDSQFYKLEFSGPKRDEVTHYTGEKIYKDVFWDNPDICVDCPGDSIINHKRTNPDFNSHGCNIFVTLHNNGTDTYTLGKKLITYWAQASSNIANETWCGLNYYNGECPTGSKINEQPISSILSGDSIKLKIFFSYPSELFDDEYRPDNHYLCFLSKIVDSDYSEDSTTPFNLIKDRTIAMSNVAVLPLDADEQSATVFINNNLNSQEAYSLELGFRTDDDRRLLDYAHIALDIRGTVFNSWYNRGGGKGDYIEFYGRSSYCIEFQQEFAKLSNIVFMPYGMGRATMYVDFFKAPKYQHNFTFDLIQRNSSGEVVGGETFIVESPYMVAPNKTQTDTLEMPRGYLELRANVPEKSKVKWYTQDNKYVGSGNSLMLSPEMRNNNYCVVSTNEYGELQTGNIAISLQQKIWDISPIGYVTTLINVSFLQKHFNYTLSLTSLTTGKTIWTEIIDADTNCMTIDMTPYQDDLYILTCHVDGVCKASHKFRKIV